MNKRVVASITMMILICGISLGLFKLWLSFDQPVERGATPEFFDETSDRDSLEGNTETKIPQSASDIHGLIDGFREITTYMRFTIPASDLEQFLSSTACTGSLLTVNPSDAFRMTPAKGWWQIGQAKDVQWCSGAKEHLGQAVYVDMTNQKIFVVYVVAQTR
jgi:hypothetical protein